MLANNDIVQFVVNQSESQTGIEPINIYHYRVSTLIGSISTPSDYEQMCLDFQTTVLTAVAALQVTTLTYTSIVFNNATNLVDTFTFTDTTPLVGGTAGNSEPPQVAYSFQLVRSTRVTRHGSKRFAGVPDSVVTVATGGNLVGAPTITAIEEALSTPIDVVISEGKEFTLIPVIVREPLSGMPVTIVNPVSAAAYRGIGSQNSRKRLL